MNANVPLTNDEKNKKNSKEYQLAILYKYNAPNNEVVFTVPGMSLPLSRPHGLLGHFQALR